MVCECYRHVTAVGVLQSTKSLVLSPATKAALLEAGEDEVDEVSKAFVMWPVSGALLGAPGTRLQMANVRIAMRQMVPGVEERDIN